VVFQQYDVSGSFSVIFVVLLWFQEK
jgi:hypothetical protein